MQKNISTVEEMLTDESFLSWYFKTDHKQAAEWEEWRNQNTSFREMEGQAIAMLKAMTISENDPPQLQLEKAQQRLFKVLFDEQKNDDNVIPLPRRKNRWIWPAAAAALIAGFFILKGVTTSNPSLETTFGEISQNQLPDGSQVFLNANSAIEFKEDWGAGDDREVWVKGEAFFKVAKTVANSRFIVHTNDFDVIVTGTEFNVINRDDRTNVALTEGSVTIKTRDGKFFEMKPGDYFEIKENIIVQKTIEPDKVIAWQKKKIMLDNTPVKDLAKEMEALYGVRVKLENDIVGRKPLTGIMPNDNLDILLTALEATGDFTITRTGKDIRISLPK